MTVPGPDPNRGPSRWAHWRVIFYLLLGLVAGDLFVQSQRQVWRSFDLDEYLERVQGCRREACEVVLVGGSPVAAGMDPAILAGLPWHGQTLNHVYNLGLPAATTSDIWHAVEHGITHPPRLLIYGITASDVNDDRDNPFGTDSLMDVGDLPRWVRYRPTAAEWGVRHFAVGQLRRLWKLFYYRNGIRLWVAEQIEDLRPGTCPEAAAEALGGRQGFSAIRHNHGFASQWTTGRFDLDQAAGTGKRRLGPLENFRLGEHWSYLRHLLDWADAKGVAVVLVDMPVSAELDELYPDAMACYRKALAELEKTGRVRVVHATRAALGLGDADFADLIHLNGSGSTRLSTWLRSELANSKRSAGGEGPTPVSGGLTLR